LTLEDQVFVMAFVRCEGTIKEMEKTFGVSYPTIKNRLGRIGKQLEFVETIVSSPVTKYWLRWSAVILLPRKQLRGYQNEMAAIFNEAQDS